jgi:hypothetical protein
MLYSMMEVIFGKDSMSQEQNHHRHSSSSHRNVPYDGMFTVHMAILTANLGKKLFVEHGCLLRCMLIRLLSMNSVSFPLRSDESCNAEIFSIKDWNKLASCASQIEGKHSLTRTGANLLAIEELLEMTKSWNNTITVTAKGAVILRFSWSNPIQWTKKHASIVLEASRMVCSVLASCS